MDIKITWEIPTLSKNVNHEPSSVPIGGSYVGSDAGIKRQMSIPADRASLVDNMEYDVISYGGTEVMSERGRPTGKSKAGSKPGK